MEMLTALQPCLGCLWAAGRPAAACVICWHYGDEASRALTAPMQRDLLLVLLLTHQDATSGKR